MLICSKCKKVADTGTFCGYCGGKIVSDSDLYPRIVLKNTVGKGSNTELRKYSSDEGASRLKGSLATKKAIQQTDRPINGSIQFKRSPRIRKEVPEEVIEIAPPPNIGGKPEINWLGTILPTVVTMCIAVIMATVLGSPMMMVYTLPMTIAGVIVSLTNYHKQTKKYYNNVQIRKTKYTEYINSVENKVSQKHNEQLSALLLADPETKDCLAISSDLEARLWERRPSDPDFACVRIGRGSVPFCVKIVTPKESISLEDDDMKGLPNKIKDSYLTVPNAPIICNILENQACGVVGSRKDTNNLIKNMIMQIVTHHCYTELKLIVIDNSEPDLEWIKSLPHTKDNSRQFSYVASTKENAKKVYNEFVEIMNQRKMLDIADNTYGAAQNRFLPYYLFVIMEPSFLEKSNPINEFLFKRNNLGIGCIIAVSSISQLPKECLEIITVNGMTGEKFNALNALDKQQFVVDKIDQRSFDLFASSLSSIVCEEEIVKESLPSRFSILDMFKISTVKTYDIVNAWRKFQTEHTLAAPIGVNEAGKIVSLDVHESYHGPHGLIAGTTRSGKSELLQTYILSMALHYSPYEVCFLIIDFKGGGLSNRFAGLPHLRGAITNISTDANNPSEESGISEDEIRRSLTSIEAELLKRQRLFAETGVNTIEKYLEKYKQHEITEPLPHLIIIVDEFAELKTEYPDFMKKLISAARIGGSLGVHLILSTQKPAGQVNEQIWSNSRFQICLRVTSESDSNEVIKSPLAADITVPGRAYLRVGNNEVFELFQSAFSSGVDSNGDDVFSSFIELINIKCREDNISRLPNICLPSLEKRIPYPQILPKGNVPLGVYDDPSSQYQGEYQLELFDKNTYIVGSSSSGKTNILQCIIRGLAEHYSSTEVNIYILDFASGVLKIFENLNYVGGVITPIEDEKLANFFKFINNQIAIRRSRFLEYGVSSFSSYCDAGKKDLPRIVILIDNLNALKDLYLQDEDPMLNICQNCLSYGISVVVTNNQSIGLGFKYLPNFSSRIALYCNDNSEYNTIFDRCTLHIPDLPGRCIVEIGKKTCLCQAYQAFSGEREIDRVTNIRSFIEKENKINGNLAAAIPVVPNELSKEIIYDMFQNHMSKRGQVVVGLSYEDVKPAVLNFNTLGVLVLSSREPLETIKFTRFLVEIAEQKGANDIQFFIADNLGRSLESCRSSSLVQSYTNIPEKSVETVKVVEKELSKRYFCVMNENSGSIDYPAIVLILNGNDVLETISNSTEGLAAFNNIRVKYKNLGVSIVLCECDNVPITYTSSEVLKKTKDERKLLCFEDVANIKITDIPFSIQRNFRKPMKKGDCFYICGNDCQKLKVVLSE